MAQIPLSKRDKDNSPQKYTPRPLKLWGDLNPQQEVRIEIVPMIDVIFCILTFFILAAVGFSRQQAISLNLPRATTGTAQMREMLVVSLDNQGQLYLEKQPVSQVQLYSAIQNYNTINPSGLMVLHAAEDVRYSQVVEILDMLKEVGGDRVALATLAGDSQIPPESETPTPGVNPYLTPENNFIPEDNGTGGGELPSSIPIPPLPESPPSP
ncbi:outer membrane transport energization protein ExbD [Cyanobacterium stanieri PCC 7202]|uniref:Outer membrane transport energization protein ExbD n=1 Tax=Cyanobacterium stanieri (strain ATCC 29140 / PCC 7202) TaxID=292563 RepID=K9YM50_CYASC|nr:outer membrane transport energization protein ExbD [Cyanobacterium stanieri PCC 7202]